MTSYLPPKHNNSKFNVADFDYQNDYLTSQSATKYTVGLGQVDNTSDANKPISSATAAALAAKQFILNTSNKLNPAYISNGIDAAQVSSGLISNAEFNTLDGISIISTIQNQLDAITGGTTTFLTLTGNQTIVSGAIKTFTTLPQSSAVPTLTNELITKNYCDGLDAQNIKISGSQTLTTGTKTFSVLPQSTTVPLNNADFVNKLYADSVISGVITLANSQTLTTGIKTFTNLPQSTAVPVNNADLTNKLYVTGLDANNLKLSGTQYVQGLKTYDDRITSNTGIMLYNKYTTPTLSWNDYIGGGAIGQIYCSLTSKQMVLAIQGVLYNGINFAYGGINVFLMAIDGVCTATQGFITDNIINNFSYISPTLKSVASLGSTLTSNTSYGNNIVSGVPCVLSSTILSAKILGNQNYVWSCVAPIGFNGNLDFKCAVSFGTNTATIVNCSTSMSATLTQVISNMRLVVYRDGDDYRNIPIPILGGNSEATQYGLTTIGKTGSFVFNQFIGDYQTSIAVAGDSTVAHTYDFLMQYDLAVGWSISTFGIDGDFDLYFNTTTSTHSSTTSPFGANISWVSPDGSGYAVSALTPSTMSMTTTGYTYANNLNANQFILPTSNLFRLNTITGSNTISASSTDTNYATGAGGNHYFNINGATTCFANSTGFNIADTKILQLGSVNTTNIQKTGTTRLDYNVPTGMTHSTRVNGVEQLQIGTGVTTSAVLNVNSDLLVNTTRGTQYKSIRSYRYTIGSNASVSVQKTSTYGVTYPDIAKLDITIIMYSGQSSYSDTFATTIAFLATTSFTFNVYRVDAPTGWGANLVAMITIHELN